MAIEFDQIAGPVLARDGFSDGPQRVSRQRSAVFTRAHGHFYESVVRGQVFTLILAATSSAVATGNVVSLGGGTAGTASTQFALINPVNSGKNLVLIKFGMGVISGTPGAGPLFHGYIPGISSITAASPGGTIRSNVLGQTGNSVATPWALAAGSALTGGQAPVVIRESDFSATATAQAIANGHVKAIENIDGGLVIPPGLAWLPLWGAQGSSLLNGYSITWEEVPV